VLIVVQLRAETRLQQSPDAESSADFAAMAGDLYDSNSALLQEVDKLQSERAAAERSVANGSSQDVASELQRLSAFNGTSPVTGPGVELSLDAELRPVDLLDLLNELRNAGSEAISIGGQRVVYRTGIGGTIGHLLVDTVPLGTPIVIDAIGAPDVLDRALARKGGMLTYLKTSYPRATISMKTSDSLSLPPYSGGFGARGG
jgi:uncharacterized protein YlxW (UPF0749 family)